MANGLKEIDTNLAQSIKCRLALDPSCNDLALILQRIAEWLIAIAGTLLFIMLLVGGIQYLTSGGNQEQSTKAKQTFLWAIVGMVIVLLSWAALEFFLRRLTSGG